MGEQLDVPLSKELIERGVRKDVAHLCHSLIVRVGSRARRAAYIDEILGDLATLYEFKKDLLLYVRYAGLVDTALKVLITEGLMTFSIKTAEYALTARGRDRMAKYFP